MKKNIYKFIFVMLMTLIIIPSKSYAADTLLTSDITGNIVCKKEESSQILNSGSSIQQNDILDCSFYFGLTDEAKEKNYEYTLNYYFDEAKINIANGLSISSRPSNVDSDGIVTNLNTGSGDNIEVVRNYKFKVDSNSGNPTISIKYKYSVKDEDGNEKLSDIEFTKSISFNIGQALSSDATLSSLSVSGLTLSPAFSSETYTYKATTKESNITIYANANDENATIDSNSIGQKNLSIGTNQFKITVTAQDGTTKKEYIINVTRESETNTSNNTSLSNDATLSTLTINGTKINLKNNTYSYSTTVSNSTTKANIGYTTTNNNAKVNISGDTNLIEGDNKIIITVTAQDGTQKDYTITIIRNIYNPKLGVNLPISIIFLGIVGLIIYIKFRNKTYIQKI